MKSVSSIACNAPAAPSKTQIFELRVATPADAAGLGALASRTFDDTFGHLYPPAALEERLATLYSPDSMRSDLERADKYTVLMFPVSDNNETQYQVQERVPCGFATLHFGSVQLGEDPATLAAHSLEIQRVYVDRAFHGCGAAQELMRHVLEVVAHMPHTRVWLIVYEHNVRAQRFYRKLGFHEVGAQPSLLAFTKDRDLVFELQHQHKS